MLAACLVWVASAQARPFVYVTNQGSNTALNFSVSQFDLIGGLLSPLTPPSVASGPVAQLAVSPNGRNVYVANPGPSSVSQYAAGSDGTLTPLSPPTVAAGSFAEGVAVSPDGKSVYVTNGFSNPATVSQYDVGAGGALTPKSPATVATLPGPAGVAVSPDGKSVYVANAVTNPGTVSQYDVGSGGTLTAKTPPSVTSGTEPPGCNCSTQPFGVVVSPDGKSVYAANSNPGGPGTVSQWDVGAGGALIPKTPATVPAGSEPDFVAVSPDGKNVYATALADNTVSQYDVGPNGRLTPLSAPTVATGPGPQGVAVSPDGNSAYVADSAGDTVSQYTVGVGGALTPKTPATVTAGTAPFGIAVSHLPIEHSTATTVRCSPGSFAPGEATICTAMVTDTASSGQSTPTGTVSFTDSGTGRFFGSPCTLSGSGASASCAVFLTSFPRGGRIIGAAYGGDATHSASSAFTGVTVAVPASTEACVVFGHGRITAASGDKASFHGLVAALPPRGVEFYRDNGPASAFRAASTSVNALTCTDDATKASVFGTARVNGTGSVEYRIDVQLAAWERGKDTYRIRLSTGYDSGARKIRRGDVDIRLRSSEHHHHDANAGRYKPGASQDGG